jgi:TonB family protein
MTARALLALLLVSLPGLAFAAPGEADPEATSAVEAVPPAVVPPALTSFVEARLPADLDLAPGTYAVTLAVTLDEAGAVTDVQVLRADAAPLAGPAVEAARRFVFSPALVEGTPVPVRITYTYTFELRPKVEVAALEAVLYEKGARRPVVGLSAFLEENGRVATSDAEGVARFADLAPGRYTVYVPDGEFAEARVPVEVPAAGGEVPRVRIGLLPRRGSSYRTLVRAPPEARYVAKQSLSFEELARLPGTGGDPLKAVQNLPGVARPRGLSGNLVILGSPPNDSQVFLEGFPFYQLYHFGSLYSVVNPEFLERIDFVPAGFDAAFGDAIGGIVDVRLKEEPVERWKGSADVNLLHAQGYGAVPYSADGDVQVAFRRSYIDGVLAAAAPASLGLTTAPRYYDYQAAWRHRSGPHRFFVFVNGTDDRLALVQDRPVGDDVRLSGQASFGTWVHALFARWTYEPRPGLRNRLGLQVAGQGIDVGAFDTFEFRVRQWPVSLRDDLDVRLADWIDARFGVEGTVGPSTAKARLPQIVKDGQVPPPSSTRPVVATDEAWVLGRVSPYVSLEIRPLPGWTVVPSLRSDTWLGYWKGWSLDPRLATRVQVSSQVALLAAGGLYSQAPFFDEISESFGNPSLGPNRGAHALAGVEWRPLERLSVVAKGFYKHSFDLTEPVDDRTVRYDNSGVGRAYGADLLVRVDPGGRFFGWIAYSFVVSERRDFQNGGWRPSEVDQRHVLNVLGSYDLGWGWSLGARFRLATGYPYTPVTAAAYDADADRWSPLPTDAPVSGRLPAFHSLDLRVDKEWRFDAWLLAAYLEVQNVYNRRNPEGIQYNYDYSQSAVSPGLPILPVLGVRAEF